MLIHGFGVVVADVGHFQATGFRLDSTASRDTILSAVDTHLLPAIRRHFHTTEPRHIGSRSLLYTSNITIEAQEDTTAAGSDELWPFTCGFNLPDVCAIRSTGHFIKHPNASREAILEALDRHFLPMVREQVARAI